MYEFDNETWHYGVTIFAGSVMSLMAGIVFGGLSAYGAYNVSTDSKNIKVSLCEYAEAEMIMSQFADNWLKRPSASWHCVMVFPFFQWPLESSQSWWEWDTRNLANYCRQASWLAWGQSRTRQSLLSNSRITQWCCTLITDFLIPLSHSLLMVFRLLLLIVAWLTARILLISRQGDVSWWTFAVNTPKPQFCVVSQLSCDQSLVWACNKCLTNICRSFDMSVLCGWSSILIWPWYYSLSVRSVKCDLTESRRSNNTIVFTSFIFKNVFYYWQLNKWQFFKIKFPSLFTRLGRLILLKKSTLFS